MNEHPEGLLPAAADLIHSIGLRGKFTLHPLTGGANNRVFRVEANGCRVLLKAYFQHADDPRDRLGPEFSFASFAWGNGLRCLPQPLACDRERRLGLYEFIQGRQLSAQEIDGGKIQEALDFYHAVNRHKWRPAAQALPEGSEASFSIAEHLGCVERRLQKLGEVDESSEINRQAADFIRKDLSEKWKKIVDSVGQGINQLGLGIDEKIVYQDRCLSPSDFGFHNAILGEDGRLRFIDFEYAGWDDPAKMINDFFCQPALPVPIEYYSIFITDITTGVLQPEIQLQRATLLLPVYQVKWCCIMLNDFLPVGLQRRGFAGGLFNQEGQKATQLQKAGKMLKKIHLQWR